MTTYLPSLSPQVERYRLTTDQFAAQLLVQPQTVRKQYADKGTYFGIAPLRLPNRRLLWPADAIEQIAASQLAQPEGASSTRSTKRAGRGDAEHVLRNASTPSPAVLTPVDVRQVPMTADPARRQGKAGEEPRAGETGQNSPQSSVGVLSASAAADNHQMQAPEPGEHRPDAGGTGDVCAQRFKLVETTIGGRSVVLSARKLSPRYIERATSPHTGGLEVGADKAAGRQRTSGRVEPAPNAN